ncbi:hypothetical protein OSB04_016477 [Centaurea solstitialis]|uniref:Uncharacterized protein n=1 Tax=Centaurea solstitialis TaxID=347529 RepID=A0AA38TJ62_9ASTR|nr:hypothetical protein OSB04_016477 [Centaurea solstitialis]
MNQEIVAKLNRFDGCTTFVGPRKIKFMLIVLKLYHIMELNLPANLENQIHAARIVELDKFKRTTKCHVCGETRHYVRECKERKFGPPVANVVVGIEKLVANLLRGKRLLNLRNVLHVCTILKCLVSYKKLGQNGFGIRGSNGTVVFFIRNTVVGKAYCDRGIYRMSLKDNAHDSDEDSNSNVGDALNESIGSNVLVVFGEAFDFGSNVSSYVSDESGFSGDGSFVFLLMNFSFSIMVAKLLANRVRSVIDSVIGNEQMAFVHDRCILDGPLIVSEIIAWANRSKRKLMVFKLDFVKAFDLISWKFIDEAMDQMNFGAKWRKWILGCLRSTLVSVNSGPTNSHLQFADNVIVLGDWSSFNTTNLVRILWCFFLSSGLNINMDKSSLGAWASTSSLYSKCLNKVINNLESIRSKFFWGLEDGAKKISWVAWNLVLNEMPKGGLGVGSLKSLNLALLSKWRWSFKMKEGTLWKEVIQSIHGPNGGLEGACPTGKIPGVWRNIIKIYKEYVKVNIPLRDFFEDRFRHDGSQEVRWAMEPAGAFSVSSLHKAYDERYLDNEEIGQIFWTKWLPLKVCINAWRIAHNRIRRGIIILSLLCPLCGEDR